MHKCVGKQTPISFLKNEDSSQNLFYLKTKWIINWHFDLFPGFLNNLHMTSFQSLSPAGSASSGGERDALNVSGGEENELPKSIIVTNVDLAVFDDEDPKVIQF